jgi:glycosyltransferase involved in cell wall biosynthesis
MNSLAVIMSVYKNDRLIFLKESVESILNQTFTQFDYYIVCDGPVGSGIDNYLSSIEDKRLRLFKLEKNGGLAAALNFLLTVVLNNPDYNLIARMDADDISMPRRFEKQNRFLIENDDISCVGCWYEEINESGKHLADIRLPVKHEDLKRRYYTGTPFAHPSVMYRRELIVKAGFYPIDTILMEDNALWGNALKAGLRFSNIPEVLLKFRIDNDFYKRRSGIRYGLNYIKTKLKNNDNLNSPFSAVISIAKGIVKMLPSHILKFFYIIQRKYQTRTY